MRLDIFLVQNGFFTSRELAKYNISKGNVLVNGKHATKPAMDVNESDSISLIKSNALRYVSKGGLKLEKALADFCIDCKDLDVLDLGASTGGFTDCVLQQGANMVFAVDVGTNQLAPQLKSNPRIVSIENVSIKDLTPEMVSNKLFHLIVTDLSFISLTKVMQYFPKFLLPQGKLIALIKPQFEVGPAFIGKGGLVKDSKAHINAITDVLEEAQKFSLFAEALTVSPLVEASRNIEYLALFGHNKCVQPPVADIVRNAFSAFYGK